MAAPDLPHDVECFLEGLLKHLRIEIRIIKIREESQIIKCHGVMDVRTLGSSSRSGFKKREPWQCYIAILARTNSGIMMVYIFKM